MKKIGIKMSLLMGLIMSFCLSIVGTTMGAMQNTGEFIFMQVFGSWLISFAASLLISWIIGFLVPIKLVGDKACGALKVNPMSMKGNLVSGFISDLIYTPFITVVMVILNVSMARKHIPEQALAAGNGPTIGKALPGSLIVCFIVAYIVIIIVQPLLIKALMKKAK